MISFKKIFKKILIWRYRHISEKKFIYILSALVGFMSGIGAVILKSFTHLIQHVLEGKLIVYYHKAFYFLFPILGFTLVFIIIKYIIRKPISHGIPSTLFSLSQRQGIMERFQMVGSILTAPITIGFGGSVGLEGPTVATGAAISSNIARMFHLNQKTRKLLVVCAASGALSAIFKAPIAAIVFAIEVFSLDLTLVSVIPLLLASISAILTSYFFFGDNVLLPFKIDYLFKAGDIYFYIILGIISSFVSIYFTKVYDRIQVLFENFKNPIKQILVGGIGMGIITFLIPPLYGEGFEVINDLIKGKPEIALDGNFFNLDITNEWTIIILLLGLIVFKVVALSLTFGARGVGGVFAPTLFMGSIMGTCTARIINNLGVFTPVSESNFTLVGMAGLMAGVLHAPLTAVFLIAELTGGYELFIPLMIVSGISYGITKYFIEYSIYTSELANKGILMTHDKDKNTLILLNIESVIETDFVKLRPDMSLRKMLKKGVCKSDRNLFPVLKKDGTLIGIVSMGDIRSIMFDKKLYNTTVVRDYLHIAPEVIFQNDDAETVMRKFKESRAWNLPVIKEDGKYVGFISKSKLLSVYRAKLVEVT